MLKNLEVNKARFDAQMYKADEALADMTISQELSTLTTQVRLTFRDLLSHQHDSILIPVLLWLQFDREVAIIEPLDLQLMYTQLSKPINRCDIVLETNQALITLSIDDYKLAMHILGTNNALRTFPAATAAVGHTDTRSRRHSPEQTSGCCSSNSCNSLRVRRPQSPRHPVTAGLGSFCP